MTDAIEILTLAAGYDRRKNPETRRYRRMTVGEAKQLYSGQRVTFEANDGTARELKINGAPKTWKRSPGVEIPIKYGMYEYDTLSARYSHDNEPFPRLLVEVKCDS